MTLNGVMAVILRYFSEFAYLPSVLRKSSRSLSHLLMSSCTNGRTKKESIQTVMHTRMWASAQRDGRPAEYRWRPLFNAAKFGWRPLPECRAVTLPRRETRWNLHGCRKLLKRSQSLVGRNSPYYEDMWRRYCCLTSFSDCRYMP